MTDEQILELAEKYLKRGGIRDDGSCSEDYGTTRDFIDFAQAIYEIGNENGWESHIESQYFNDASCRFYSDDD